MNLIEKKIQGETVFQGRLLNVKKDTVLLPNGKTSTREYILHNGAVAVIAVLKNGNIIMENQFRYPNQKVYLELPAGKLEVGEDPIEAAKRELLEETGAVAKNIEFLCDIEPTIAYSSEVIHIYLATDIEISQQQLDEDEFVEVVEYSLGDLLEMIKNNQIPDSKTVCGLLHYAMFKK